LGAGGGQYPPARSANAIRCARYRASHLDAERARNRAYSAQVRAQVFDRYGWACWCCGATGDPTIDHRDGRGREHRMALFGAAKRGGKPMYLWLIRHGFPEGFQTACRRCNTSKSRGPACRLDHDAERLAA
jgi:hypothetical protein